MKEYILGNHLRGHFTGKFKNNDDALNVLSARFLLSYPVEEGSSGFEKLTREVAELARTD